jgi:hypothetical protein
MASWATDCTIAPLFNQGMNASARAAHGCEFMTGASPQAKGQNVRW